MAYKLTCLLTVLTLSAALAVSQQPATSPTQDPSRPGAQAPQSSQPSRASSSVDVQSEIETAFQKDSSLASDGLSVKVIDDKVELSGEVANDAEREKARSIAEANAGGRKVVNKIKIKVKGGSEAPPKY